jgi:hypothetical protein
MLGIFLFTTASRLVLGPTQPPVQWVTGALSLGIKWPVREADHSPPSSAEVKECVELYLHSPNTPSWRGAQLNKSTGTTLSQPYFSIFPCSRYFVLSMVKSQFECCFAPMGCKYHWSVSCSTMLYQLQCFITFLWFVMSLLPKSKNSWNYEGASKSFRIGRLERGLQMVQLSATRCSYISVLWVSLVSFAAITFVLLLNECLLL